MVIKISKSNLKQEKQIQSNWELLLEEVETYSDDNDFLVPKIIVVSKTRSIEEIRMAYDAGIRDFAENYAQELESKANLIDNVNWHFIGHLQRSNVKRIVKSTKLLHTLDSVKLGRKLANSSFKSDSLIQIKMGTELSKHGIEGNLDSVQELIYGVKQIGLNVIGLMAIGSIKWDVETRKKEYLRLNKMRQELALPELSLGMSDDYKEAIFAGSTMIRIGTRIFGPRVVK